MQLILLKDNANRAENEINYLFLIPRCSLSYPKIMQIESNGHARLRPGVRLNSLFYKGDDERVTVCIADFHRFYISDTNII